MAGMVNGLVMKMSEKLSGTFAVNAMASATAMNICPGTGSIAQYRPMANAFAVV